MLKFEGVKPLKHGLLVLWLFAISPALSASNSSTKDSSAVLPEVTGDWDLEVHNYVNHLDSFFMSRQFNDLFFPEDAGSGGTEDAVVIPEIPDSVYALGLSMLNASTPFELAYNNYVRAFIELYLFKKREITERCMGLSGYYFPVFEEMLDKYDLPIEFKYLAVVESALNISARSRAGAAGLWQFMYHTGKFYGLEINSYVDERYELYASTDAACRYFKDLYNLYGNWELVMAAYNCGPGNVNKAIRRSGGKRNYWEIRQWLPRETRGYVPAFIAVNYAMNHAEELGLKARHPDTINLYTDTLYFSYPLKLNDFCDYFCANPEELEYLNPSYRRFSFPDDNREHLLRLPLPLMNAYLEEQEAFIKYIEAGPDKETSEPVAVHHTPQHPSSAKTRHVVRSGEVLGVIAERYGCSVRQIMDWNNLYSSRINVGQVLVVYPTKKVTAAAPPPVKSSNSESKVSGGKLRYHIVKPGDTLWDIANMYDGVTVSELKRLNKDLNHKNLKPGSKIIVSSNS